MKRIFKICMLSSALCLLTTHAFAKDPQDPYEPFNRAMFQFNDWLDRLIIKPVATLYNAIVPKPLVTGISHFFNNIDNIPTIANDLLQTNFYQANRDAWRLVINSTVGVVGLFDVAAQMGLEPNTEDLGLTFAHWGYKNSYYLVLPFLGPMTIRDSLAWPINYEFLTIYPHVRPARTRYALYGLSVVDDRAHLLQYENVMEQAALDKYVFIRDAYLQRRNYQIQRNNELGNPYFEKEKV